MLKLFQRRGFNKLLSGSGLLVLCLIPKAVSAENNEKAHFFEKNIRPIFQNHCIECHGAEKQKGGLSLHLKSLAFEGGDTGTPIIAGQANQSLLIKGVERINPDFVMPPKTALSSEKISLLKQWVNMGAYWPEDQLTHTRRVPPAKNIAEHRGKHWAYRPLGKNSNLTGNIDRIIEKGLQKENLSFSPRADARTLLRRAYYGLIGLPPSYEEVKAFEKDPSDEHYSSIIEKLLSKKEYGEHWGRHWLDVARYADTKGAVVVTATKRYPFSYTYRDYVIGAFNRDLPYDRFIQEQLAADLLPGIEENSPELAALGFITVGRRSRINDDIIDERIDAVTRGLLGTTVTCARCHDHKFDPVSIKDYYALYGVFKSIHEPKISELPIIGHSTDEKERAKFEQSMSDLQKQLEEVKLELKEKYEENHKKGMADYLDYYVKKDSKWKIKGEVPMQGKEVLLRRNSIRKRTQHIKALKGDHFLFGPFKTLHNLPKDKFANLAQAYLKKQPKHVPNWLWERILLDHQKNPWKSFYEVSNFYQNLLLNHSSIELSKPQKHALTNYVYKYWIEIPKDTIRSYLQVGPDLDKYTKLDRKIEDLMAVSRGAPHRAMVVKDNQHAYNPKVFIRGNSSRHGPAVSRRFLELLYPVTGGEKFQHGSGRLELAKAISHPNNPLTARVMMNRIWAWHFGSPLVRTPSDFGLQTEAPLQLELLDYLAEQFIKSGWSIKAMHRMIVNSKVYQQSSERNESYYAKDPSNEYLWKFNAQPLQYEQMRDSILKVADMLNYNKGGRPHMLETHHTKRAIYTLVNRNDIPDEFNVFGVADPNSSVAKRIDTLVPQQALYFMNSPFVISQAQNTLKSRRMKNLEGIEWVKELFKVILQRDIRESELQAMMAFMQEKQIDRSLDRRYDWSYGYQDRKAGIHFKQLRHYAQDNYRIPKNQQKPGQKSLRLSRKGGDPGGNIYPNIRRWTSSIHGEVHISQELKHLSDKGEGVKFQVILNEKEILMDKVVFNDSDTFEFNVLLKENDTLDFLTHCHKSLNHDFYERHIKIKEIKEGGRQWDSISDFDKPLKAVIPYDNKLAIVQTLLSSNEFSYLD